MLRRAVTRLSGRYLTPFGASAGSRRVIEATFERPLVPRRVVQAAFSARIVWLWVVPRLSGRSLVLLASLRPLAAFGAVWRPLAAFNGAAAKWRSTPRSTAEEIGLGRSHFERRGVASPRGFATLSGMKLASADLTSSDVVPSVSGDFDPVFRRSSRNLASADIKKFGLGRSHFERRGVASPRGFATLIGKKLA